MADAGLFSRLPDDILSSILMRNDIRELRDLRDMSERFQTCMLVPSFIRRYNEDGARAIWHVVHGFDAGNADNHWIIATREDDNVQMIFRFEHHTAYDADVFDPYAYLPPENPYHGLTQELRLLGIWNSSCLFKDGKNGFVVYNWWTGMVVPIPYNNAGFLTCTNARMGARIIPDPFDDLHQLVHFFHHSSVIGTFGFDFRMSNQTHEQMPSLMVDELNDEEITHPLFMVVPYWAASVRNWTPVHVLHQYEAAMGEFLDRLPALGNHMTRLLVLCNNGYIAVVDRLHLFGVESIMMIALGRFSGNRYEYLSRVPEDELLGNMVRMRGHRLEMIGDHLVNFSVVLIPEEKEDGPMQYLMFRYDVLEREWKRINGVMPALPGGRLEPTVFCARFGM
ncbi:hypothetical protein QVD17_40922 [Tagetes erecta]|uniref:F-box domain-containing protein n=1 Tax=Tagetes erecta TaxID=13708 RepID=A0AAD8JUC0_TARER|nr:hypothetical protein QVD17_40922 [Tagetes erecta]